MKDIGQAPNYYNHQNQETEEDEERNYLTAENGVKIFYIVDQKQSKARPGQI